MKNKKLYVISIVVAIAAVPLMALADACTCCTDKGLTMHCVTKGDTIEDGADVCEDVYSYWEALGDVWCRDVKPKTTNIGHPPVDTICESEVEAIYMYPSPYDCNEMLEGDTELFPATCEIIWLDGSGCY
jgi:hypothetical protein